MVTEDIGDDSETVDDTETTLTLGNGLRTEADFRARAAQAYSAYSGPFKPLQVAAQQAVHQEPGQGFAERRPGAYRCAQASCGQWNPDHDAKLGELIKLIKTRHSKEKLLIFTQFADTARYLKAQLTARKHQTWKKPPARAPTPPPLPGVLASFQRQARLGAFR
jgi:hypothetical protein